MFLNNFLVFKVGNKIVCLWMIINFFKKGDNLYIYIIVDDDILNVINYIVMYILI